MPGRGRSFAQAITDAAPHLVQVGDRWHLWHLLGEAAHWEVLAQSTRERWQQVHDLREQGVGLL